MMHVRSFSSLAAVWAALVIGSVWSGQAQRPAPPPGQTPRPDAKIDPERAKRLYVSNNPDDNSLGHDFQRDVDEKKKTDARFAEASKGVMDFQKVTYRSTVGDLDISGVPTMA